MGEQGQGQDQAMSMGVEGQGTAEQKDVRSDAVEYGAGAEKSPMEELAEASEDEKTGEAADTATESASPMSELAEDSEGTHEPTQEPAQDPGPKESSIDQSKVVEVPEGGLPPLSKSTREGFNPQSTQNAKKDAEVEGGITTSRTTGPMKSSGDAAEDGSQLKPAPDMVAESKPGQYEVTGFSASYEPAKGKGLESVQIRDYFDDMETAMASVNGDKYLMPLPGGGYKIATITQGAPTISIEERQLYEYINGKWRRS